LSQDIVTGDSARLHQAMTNAIPSLSLVTGLANLFNAQRGIYVNPGNDGIGWERPVSVELIDPVNGSGSEFQIDAGLRIRGAYSRSSSNPKHSFRLLFRSDYGEARLRFPLFGQEGASAFDKVDLRTSQNDSWAFETSGNETFVRETFSRDSQRDLGMPYTRSRYYHLFLNGQYWGLFQTQERGDADFAATYLGGASADWDCIKTTQPGYTTTASDGTFDAFHALYDIAVNQGFSGANAANYLRVKGRSPDGTRNPAYPVYLDEDNLIIYMLVAYYTGDPDSPVSIWGGIPNNMCAVFNRAAPTGFQWLRHDAEHSLGAHGSYGVNCDTTSAGANLTTRDKFNPAILDQRLCEHPDYRRRSDLARPRVCRRGLGARPGRPGVRWQRDGQPGGDAHPPLRERGVRDAGDNHLPAPHLHPRLDQRHRVARDRHPARRRRGGLPQRNRGQRVARKHQPGRPDLRHLLGGGGEFARPEHLLQPFGQRRASAAERHQHRGGGTPPVQRHQLRPQLRLRPHRSRHRRHRVRRHPRHAQPGCVRDPALHERDPIRGMDHPARAGSGVGFFRVRLPDRSP
jgi:hypothetical protein